MTETKTKIETKKLPTLSERLDEISSMHDELVGGRLYGPFTNYQIVTTDFGDFGLKRGLVLGFVMIQKLNKETFQMEDIPQAHYFRLKDGERVRGNGVHPSDFADGEEDYGVEHAHGDNLVLPENR
jgi:hypothetical protein